MPKFCIITVTLPKTISKKQVQELSKGFSKACKEFKIQLLGGDTNQGTEISIHVVLFGNVKKYTKRQGAKTGDIICTTGAFGYTAAALDIILKKKKDLIDGICYKTFTLENEDEIDILSTNKSVYGYLAISGEADVKYQWSSSSTNTKANIDYQERAYKDPDIVLPSLENTKNITGWSPKTDIKHGVENTVKWYFENRDLIKNLKYL